MTAVCWRSGASRARDAAAGTTVRAPRTYPVSFARSGWHLERGALRVLSRWAQPEAVHPRRGELRPPLVGRMAVPRSTGRCGRRSSGAAASGRFCSLGRLVEADWPEMPRRRLEPMRTRAKRFQSARPRGARLPDPIYRSDKEKYAGLRGPAAKSLIVLWHQRPATDNSLNLQVI